MTSNEIKKIFNYLEVGELSEGRHTVKAKVAVGVYRFGHVDKKGKITTPIIYDETDDFHHGRAWVRLNDKRGFVDLDGQVVVPIKYDGAGQFKRNRAWVTLNSKRGFVDPHGQVVIPIKYDFVADFLKDKGIAWARIGKKCGFLDLNGKEVVPIIWDLIGLVEGDTCSVKINNSRHGVINLNGVVLEGHHDLIMSVFNPNLEND